MVLLPRTPSLLTTPECKDNTTKCYDTYDLSNPAYTDVSTDDVYGRAWFWMLCNEP